MIFFSHIEAEGFRGFAEEEPNVSLLQEMAPFSDDGWNICVCARMRFHYNSA